MEKIGLFDLIDKFAAESSERKTLNPAPENARKKDYGNVYGGKNEKKDSAPLRDPDFGAPPQYLMNAKLSAFLKRHETLKAEVPHADEKNARSSARNTARPAAKQKRAAKPTRRNAESEKDETKKSAGDKKRNQPVPTKPAQAKKPRAAYKSAKNPDLNDRTD